MSTETKHIQQPYKQITKIPLTSNDSEKELKYIYVSANKNDQQKQKNYNLKNAETEQPYKWTSFTHTGNETTKIQKMLKRKHRNINIAFKAINNLNKLISNKVDSVYMTRKEYTN